MVGRGASLDGRLFLGGTDGSNPVPSSGELANLRFLGGGAASAVCHRASTLVANLASCSRLNLPVREVNGCRSGSAKLTFNHSMTLVPRG